jgi:hypothetical protein
MRKVMFLLAVFGFVGLLWAADPFVGTWKLNLAKSKYDPGPPPKSTTGKIEAQDNGFKLVADSVDSQGKPGHVEYTVKYVGKDYPVTTTGGPSDLTLAIKKIDANTHDVVVKQGGKEVQTYREVVSKDGKTLTRTTKGKNAKGQAFNNTVVFDRQ